MMVRPVGVLLLALLSTGLSVPAQKLQIDSEMQRLHIPRVSRAPKLSDFLNGVPREAELVVNDFRQYMPGDGVPASQPTTAYLSYDDKNLYVVYVCKDDPKLIRARVAKHDQIMQDDRVLLNIDTFHDRRHMYWFDFNPYGVQADGNVTDGVEDDPTWDTVWYTEGRITGDGYVVLAAVPFKSIRFPSTKEQVWGLILGRVIRRNNEFSVWPHMSSRKPGWVQQGGTLEGLHDISPGRNVQFIPYGLFSRARYLNNPPDDAARLKTENDGRAGLDTKVVVKDAFTLDLALNPDFSQVESDEPQVTVNQRYEVYFPEKRPFFLENAGFFRTPEMLLFSRRIVDPRLGAKLTGKVGRWSLGAFFADDRAPGENVDASDPSHGRSSPVGVVRILREWRRRGRTSIFGAMATSQDFGTTYNRVYSIDTRLQLLQNWIFTGQAITSNTRLANGQKLAGPAYFATWRHFGRHLVYGTNYTDRSPHFRSQLGFFRRVDIRQVNQQTGYLWRPEKRTIQSFGPVVNAMIDYDHQGRLLDWNLSPQFQLGLTRGTQFLLERAEIYEYYGGIGFRKYQNRTEFNTEWLRWLTVQTSYRWGMGVNYTPAVGVAPFLGKAATASAGFELRPGPRLQVNETYLYSAMRTGKESRLSGTAAGTPVFYNHIVRSKVNYQFSREFSLRCIVDFNSVLPNHALVSMEKEKRVGLDVLFTYMLNPGTALYVGYIDLHENYRLDPLRSPSLYRTTGLDLNTGRQVFVKLSYLFRF
jgi:hypothetical protein